MTMSDPTKGGTLVPHACPACAGEGWSETCIEIHVCPETGWRDYAREQCEWCHGSGGYWAPPTVRRPRGEMAVTTGSDADGEEAAQ